MVGGLQMCIYSSMDGVLFCKTHFEQLFKETGSFSKKFTPGCRSADKDLVQPHRTFFIQGPQASYLLYSLVPRTSVQPARKQFTHWRRFIDDALREGVPVAVLASCARNGEKISRSIVEKLEPERTSKIKIVGKEEIERSVYGQLVLGVGVASSLDEQLVREAQKAASAEKQRVAEEVASLLKLSVDINTTAGRCEKMIATLQVGAEYVRCDVQICILVGGSQPSVLAAERIGIPCIVVRSSLTARVEFQSAMAVMDGFGDTDLTISKLLSKKWY